MPSIPQPLALFLPGLYNGGAERVMLNLAQGLVERGQAVDLLLARAEGAYLDQVPKTVRLIELNTSRLKARQTLLAVPALVRYLRSERPTVLLSALHANVIALWARRLAAVPVRLVISEHNTFSHANRQLPGWQGWLMAELVQHFYPWADGIVAVSRGVADDLAGMAGLPRRRIQVIYNPIITPELRKRAQAPLQHPWFGPGCPPVVLAVGRLTEQKDFATLLCSFAQIRRARPARLLILGEGELRPALEDQVRRLGLQEDVSLPGFVANPYAYMSRAALLVLSSRWEGLPTVLAEALYCGPAIVATDCPSGPREILADGRYGRLVPPGDVDSLARAMAAALNDKRLPPPRESWSPFELETVVSQYLDVFQVPHA